MPINVAEALNLNCPACITTAIAKQIVVSVTSAPSDELLRRLTEELRKLDAIDEGDSPADVLDQVNAVTDAIKHALDDSGITYPKATPTPEAAGTPEATATPDGERDPAVHPERHADADAQRDADGERDPDAHPHGDRHRHPDGDRHADPEHHPDADADAVIGGRGVEPSVTPAAGADGR